MDENHETRMEWKVRTFNVARFALGPHNKATRPSDRWALGSDLGSVRWQRSGSDSLGLYAQQGDKARTAALGAS